MFFRSQPPEKVDHYVKLLQKVGALSNLFSDSTVPYLYYRAAENIFCRAFEADNHSRSDTAIDAGKDGLGIGIKTFINGGGKSFQKVAEFDKNRKDYIKFKDEPEKVVEFISSLRNERIEFAKSAHELNEFLYHCVAREHHKFLVFEEAMQIIDTSKLNITKVSESSIYFTDGTEEYNFNLPKSTLFKRFITSEPFTFEVSILEDPYAFLESASGLITGIESYPRIYLPLFSVDSDGAKYVPEKSGLNQWNASGRPRNQREVYIKIPLWIHKVYPDFFPPENKPFNLKLPNGDIISAKVCQQGGKALMSNPNKALGEWLIDRVLKIKPGNIVTYDLLEKVGTDTVEIRKADSDNYEIDFKNLGVFDEFEKVNRK